MLLFVHLFAFLFEVYNSLKKYIQPHGVDWVKGFSFSKSIGARN